MRILLLAVVVLVLVLGLFISLRRAEQPLHASPSTAQVQTPQEPTREQAPPQPERAVAATAKTQPAPPQPSNAQPPPTVNAPPDNDAAIAEWHARRQERDFAYWDMKLNMLRKIKACIGDKMQTLGAAEVDFHFKKQDGQWLADHADLRDPDDEERAHMGGVDFRGADRELAQRCIGEAFAGTTMPIPPGTDTTDDYIVRGQVMFPTSADRAWQETGVNP